MTTEQTTINSLHHAARQYCMDRVSHCQKTYQQLHAAGAATITATDGTWTYTAEAYRTFPRYNVLGAILADIERFVPSDFKSLEEAVKLLAIAGETAQNIFTKGSNPEELQAAADERQQFIAFIRSTNPSRLSTVQQLPFHRVLGTDEHKSLHDALARKWGKWYGGYVNDKEFVTTQVVTLFDKAMDEPKTYDALRRILIDHGINRLLELREWGEGFELDTAIASFTYNGAEGFWTDSGMSWLVYASHESSITFAGTWIIEKIRPSIPEFERYIYKGWDPAAYGLH